MPLVSLSFFLYAYAAPRDLHSFPTRRSSDLVGVRPSGPEDFLSSAGGPRTARYGPGTGGRDERNAGVAGQDRRSEEHTSELQSRLHLVCRLLLEKKKKEK